MKMNELNKAKWSNALIDFSNDNLGKVQAVSRLTQIKNIGFEEITIHDLQLLDNFYVYLDSSEQCKLKEYIINKFNFEELS